MKQKSYVMVKPEFANEPKVIAEIVRRLINAGLEIVEEGYVQYDEKTAARHYHEHVEKDFYPNLRDYITSDKAYGMVVEGENAIAIIRDLAGSTKNPDYGTIRYDIPEMLGIKRRVTENVVHSSDSEKAAEIELAIFEELREERENY